MGIRDESEGGSEGAAGGDEDGGGVLSDHETLTATNCLQSSRARDAGITKNVF